MTGGEEKGPQEPHVVVLTRAAEFHLLGRRCVGVRERSTGSWQSEHAAWGTALRGSRPLDGGELWPGALRAGAALVLGSADAPFVSGEVLAIEHPRPDDSERALEAARQAERGEASAAPRGGRLLAFSMLAGLLPWLGPRG